MLQTHAIAHARNGRSLLLALLVVALTTPAFAQPSARKGSVTNVKVHGKSLAGNLEGDSPDRDVYIYLPPGYASNRNQRYPVVYLLHGYGLTAERWMSFTNLAALADKTIAAGTMKEMIIVNPDAYTVHGGSMYSASATVGDWESYIADDLVAYVDKTYRTIADRSSRGLGGHSMGGYGVYRIGMKRPDVFSSLYPMSACCLIDANLLGSRGRGAGNAGGRAGANQPAPAQVTPPTQVTPPAPQGQPAGSRGDGARGQADGARGGRGGGAFNVQFGLAAAWAPNPKNPPQYFDLPTKDGEPQPLVIARFAANSPFAMLPQYVTNLKRYKAIMVDVGEQDTLLGSNRDLVQVLSDFGVPHTFETYQGDHTNRVPDRIEQKVLPFFSNNLSFTAPKK